MKRFPKELKHSLQGKIWEGKCRVRVPQCSQGGQSVQPWNTWVTGSRYGNGWISGLSSTQCHMVQEFLHSKCGGHRLRLSHCSQRQPGLDNIDGARVSFDCNFQPCPFEKAQRKTPEGRHCQETASFSRSTVCLCQGSSVWQQILRDGQGDSLGGGNIKTSA